MPVQILVLLPPSILCPGGLKKERCVQSTSAIYVRLVSKANQHDRLFEDLAIEPTPQLSCLLINLKIVVAHDRDREILKSKAVDANHDEFLFGDRIVLPEATCCFQHCFVDRILGHELLSFLPKDLSLFWMRGAFCFRQKLCDRVSIVSL